MTIAAAISQLDSLVPNTCSQTDKISWLDRVDMQVKTEILEPHGDGAELTGYTAASPQDTELLIPVPFDECYLRYMEAQVHYIQGEIARYKNAMALFNAVYAAFAQWYHRSGKPMARSVFYG